MSARRFRPLGDPGQARDFELGYAPRVESPEEKADLDRPCVCGHTKRDHWFGICDPPMGCHKGCQGFQEREAA